MILSLPTEQQLIRTKCVHPTGAFIEFEQEAVGRSIPERFEQTVRHYPERIAIKTTTHALTYDELNKRANRLTRAILAQHGEGKQSVALLIEDRSLVVTAILGVLKAGKIYVLGSFAVSFALADRQLHRPSFRGDDIDNRRCRLRSRAGRAALCFLRARNIHPLNNEHDGGAP